VGGWHINTALAQALFENPPADPYLGYRGARVYPREAIGWRSPITCQ
jgi:hypothetical protein